MLFNEELTSLSAIMKDIKGYNVAGPLFFTFNGELLTEIAERTQWKNFWAMPIVLENRIVSY